MKRLALDVGQRRIGVATSDSGGLLATPLTAITCRGSERDVGAVLALAREHGAEEIVVGLPISLSGREGPQATRVRAFVERLAQAAAVPVRTWDERFSSQEAERLLRASGAQPSRQRARVDAAAAAVVLQAYLDARRASPDSSAR